MPPWLLFSILLALAYAALMLVYLYGWRKTPVWKTPAEWQLQTTVTVLIPARNEATQITDCLDSILSGSYPSHLLEIIVPDDFSEDGTAEVVENYARLYTGTASLHVLRLSSVLPAAASERANKKHAIELGVSRAQGDIIVTTDADCMVGKNWLRTIVSRLNAPDEPLLLTGPVAFHREQNLLQRFQSLDFLGLMGITGAGIQLGFQRMGNGANLAYYRHAFQAVNGYEGNRDTASGDDMFLIQKLAARFPGRIVFLKNTEAVVRTEAKPDWRSFVQQRLRWGTKNAGLPEWPVRLSLLAVFLFCWSIWINLGLMSLFDESKNVLQTLVFQLFIKTVFDWLLLREMCRFFGRTDLLRWFVPAFVLHTLYIPLVGTGSLFYKKYEWKGRAGQR
ncbi:MAG TPA: glycosyltransferase [Saprospiraceae bacterium]|nr:glycosyltransferase [Saprospiraceae bacterium]